MASFWDVQRKNTLYSYGLVLLFIPLIAGLGLVASNLFYGGAWIFPVAILFAIFYSIGGYWFGDSVVLAVSGAHPADERAQAYLINTVEGLALAAGIPKPKLYVIDDPSPNAFATGRDPAHASIAVTSGLLSTMNREQLEGVLSHEMSHIRNFDTRFMTVVIVLVGLVAILANMLSNMFFFGSMRRDDNERGGGGGLLMILGLVLIILGPLFAQLVRLAISRKREFLADASGAQLSRNPEGLASALERLKGAAPMSNANSDTPPLFISDPAGGEKGKKSLGQSVANLFSTHPPLDERIKALRSM
ncbi:MAG: M48 family metallopeptidase [Candidatus Micrarchaeota archaeon]